MAKKTRTVKKSSNIFQSKVGLIFIGAVVLIIAYFLYNEHQNGVLGASTSTVQNNSQGNVKTLSNIDSSILSSQSTGSQRYYAIGSSIDGSSCWGYGALSLSGFGYKINGLSYSLNSLAPGAAMCPAGYISSSSNCNTFSLTLPSYLSNAKVVGILYKKFGQSNYEYTSNSSIKLCNYNYSIEFVTHLKSSGK